MTKKPSANRLTENTYLFWRQYLNFSISVLRVHEGAKYLERGDAGSHTKALRFVINRPIYHSFSLSIEAKLWRGGLNHILIAQFLNHMPYLETEVLLSLRKLAAFLFCDKYLRTQLFTQAAAEFIIKWYEYGNLETSLPSIFPPSIPPYCAPSRPSLLFSSVMIAHKLV